MQLSGGWLATEEGGGLLAVRGSELRLDEDTASSQRLEGPGAWGEGGEREEGGGGRKGRESEEERGGRREGGRKYIQMCMYIVVQYTCTCLSSTSHDNMHSIQ